MSIGNHKNNVSTRSLEELQTSEQRYRGVFESARDGILIVDAVTRKIIDANPFMVELLGYTHQEFLNKELWEIGVLKDREESVNAFRELQREDYFCDGDLALETRDGEHREVEFVSYVYLEGGREVIQCNIRDITERTRAEEAMQKSEGRFRQLVESSITGIIIVNFDGTVIEANDVFLKMVGYEREELIAGTVRWDEMTPPELLWQDKHAISEMIAGRDSIAREKAYIHKDGSRVPVMVGGMLVKGSTDTVMAFVLDISEQKRTEKELGRLSSQNEDQARAFDILLSSISDMTYSFDRELRFRYANKTVLDLYGKTLEELIGRNFADLGFSPEMTDEVRHSLQQVLDTGNSVRGETQFPNAAGEMGVYEYIFNPVPSAERTVEFIVGSAREMTERKHVEEALRQAEAKYRNIVESLPAIVYLTQPYYPYDPIYVSPNVTALGYAPEDWYADRNVWVDKVHKDDRDWVRREFVAAASQGLETDLEYRIVAPDGSIHWWQDRGRFISDENGDRIAWQGIIQETTKTKELEHQLRQAQKLESVGLLAGGIAHDFNNMLTAINGYSELTLRNLKHDDPLRHNIEEIQKAGRRSTDLTNQLLAFSRRQVLQPMVLDLNETITDTLKMLQHLIGEDIHLTAVLSPMIGRVIFDPGQFSQIIMNLTVNARDAMPKGGKLTLETANVVLDQRYIRKHVGFIPGSFVMLAVSDNGVGMSAETKQQIFEPFFTTKEVGQGTGLGLAMVYGSVKQSGGNIEVYSEEGIGTTFKIYIPRVTEKVPAPELEVTSSEMPEGTETILLVEDEEIVRRLSKQILEECGYSVIEAENGVRALAICEQDIQIDLLLTDVVMPVMGGRELAEKLKDKFPDLRILFTSGYTDDAVVRHGVIEANTNFIQKPFTPESLAQKIRKVLEQSGKA